MSRLIDNLVAYRVLSMLVTNFTDTKAFKLGIIDAKGKNLRKSYTLKTTEERDAYNYLNRLVFNMKKIINRLPGGESKLKSITAAYFLVKEYYESNNRTTSLMEQKYIHLLEKLDNDLYLVEEELIIKKWIEESQITELSTELLARYKTASHASAKASDEAGNYKKGDKRFSGINKATRKQFDNDLKKHGQYQEEMAANCTGAAVTTDTPAPLKKDIKKYKNIARRKPPVEA